jgi:hypothetical protein
MKQKKKKKAINVWVIGGTGHFIFFFGWDVRCVWDCDFIDNKCDFKLNRRT